jgi:hypothetical protein
MHLIGTLALGWMWLQMAELAVGKADDSFYTAKLATARYYAERWLPECATFTRTIEAGAEATMALAPEQFLRA